jgi:predicted secreted protein
MLFVSTFLLLACTDPGRKAEYIDFKELPAIREIKPQKPVRIKLKRNSSGSYSWELNGNDADKVLQINKKLAESLEAGE